MKYTITLEAEVLREPYCPESFTDFAIEAWNQINETEMPIKVVKIEERPD